MSVHGLTFGGGSGTGEEEEEEEGGGGIIGKFYVSEFGTGIIFDGSYFLGRVIISLRAAVSYFLCCTHEEIKTAVRRLLVGRFYAILHSTCTGVTGRFNVLLATLTENQILQTRTMRLTIKGSLSMLTGKKT